MGHRLLQSYLENKCPDANVAVNLGKLLKGVVDPEGAAGGDAAVAVAPVEAAAASGLKLLVDAESCLDRLYGGMHADWLAGGDWNRMLEFLTSLRDACQDAGVTLIVFLNGALEVPHLREWAKDQAIARAHVKTALKECFRPRRIRGRLWVAPAGLRMALRLVLRQLGIEMACSMEDHRLEAMTMARERRLDGVMARHGSYVIFDPPRYFSANSFKLTFKKEILVTEFVVDNLAKSFDLIQDRFRVLGALLGNHILTADELKPFHKRLVQAKAASAGAADATEATASSSTETASDDAAISPSNNLILDAVVEFVRRLPSIDDLDALAKLMFDDASDAELFKHLKEKLKASIAYYNKGSEKVVRKKEGSKKSPAPAASPSDRADSPTQTYSPFASDSEEEKRQLLTETLSPSKSVSQLMLLRHQRGLLSPLILQVLTHRHVKLEAIIEDVADPDTPSAIDLYQDLRRRVYWVLLDAKSKKSSAEELIVNEWFATEENPNSERPHPVSLEPLDSADIPSLESLWFGAEPEDGQRRLRAFLNCLKIQHDDKLLLDKEKIPRQYLVLCVVLRYIMEYGKETGKPLLSKAELEAFLATAICPMMRNVRVTKEMQLRKINKRGLALGALFMQGVEYVALANDACGAPVPWQLTRPWEFFDGKIFHLKYLKSVAGSPLLEVCDNKVQHLVEVERMRDAILGDRGFVFAELKPAVAVAVTDEGAAGDASDGAAAAAAASTPASGAIPKKSKAKKGAKSLLTLPTNGANAAQPQISPAALMSPMSPFGAGKEAEIYAAAYAQAYVAYCTGGSNNSKMPMLPSPQPRAHQPAARQQMEAEAYAKGYATAMAQSGGGSPQHPARGGYKRPILSAGGQRQSGAFQRPPRGGGRGGRGSAQSRIIRQAAAYCNFHFGAEEAAAAAAPNAGARVGTGRRGGRGGRGKKMVGGGNFPAVDARTPVGANWNTIMGF